MMKVITTSKFRQLIERSTAAILENCNKPLCTVALMTQYKQLVQNHVLYNIISYLLNLLLRDCQSLKMSLSLILSTNQPSYAF